MNNRFFFIILLQNLFFFFIILLQNIMKMDKIQKISVDEKAEDENKNNFINGFMKKGFLENA